MVPAELGEATVRAPGTYIEARDLEGNCVIVDTDSAATTIADIFDLEMRKPENIDLLTAVAYCSIPLRVLEDDNENIYLAPSSTVYLTEKGKVTVDGVLLTPKPYKDGYILETPKDSPETIRNLASGNLKKLYVDIDDTDDLFSALVENKWIIECPGLKQYQGKFDSESLTTFPFKDKKRSFQLTKNETGVFVCSFTKNPPPAPGEPQMLTFSEREGWIIAPTSAVSVVKTDKTVERNKQKYKLTNDGNEIVLVGHNIMGSVQLKVENNFTTPDGKTRSLHILSETEERTLFYENIDPEAFIKTFIAGIILRPQDGKVTDLEESNVLFAKNPLSPQELEPILIDLDETFPETNQYSKRDEFKGVDKVHIIRFGLMGFPQAQKDLSPFKEFIENLIENINSSKDDVKRLFKEMISKGVFNQNHEDAYFEVIDKINEFFSSPTRSTLTLEDLFFHSFPEYKEQWELLDDMPREKKASYIGLYSEEALMEKTGKKPQLILDEK
ncbi:MAG: hypothetical protein WCG42_04645 [Parachlamydiaceae bacterium]